MFVSTAPRLLPRVELPIKDSLGPVEKLSCTYSIQHSDLRSPAFWQEALMYTACLAIQRNSSVRLGRALRATLHKMIWTFSNSRTVDLGQVSRSKKRL